MYSDTAHMRMQESDMPPALIIFYEQTRKLHELTEKKDAFSVLNRRYLRQTPNATLSVLPTSCIKASIRISVNCVPGGSWDSSLLIWFGGSKSPPQQQALCRGVWQRHSVKHSSGHGLGFLSLSLSLSPGVWSCLPYVK